MELFFFTYICQWINSFIILLVAQFIIGVAFFSLRNKVIEVLKKNDTSGINELVSQTRIKYLVFFIIVVVLLVLFLFVFIAFGGAYGGGFSDYFLPGIVALIFLEIFPFLWSLIISLLYYLGIKQKVNAVVKLVDSSCFNLEYLFLIYPILEIINND